MRPRWGAVRHVHFVGIGGVGMTALAEILLDDGLRVSGCDRETSLRTRRLEDRGAVIELGHDAGHLEEVDAVIVTAAVPEDHPELRTAKDRGLPVVRRAQFLAEVVRADRTVAVAGTHGKTTTAALFGAMLSGAGADPTIAVGGLIRGLDVYGRRGSDGIAVCEADEFDRSFLELKPLVAVVTNVEQDHLDCYDGESALRGAFSEFVSKTPFHGAVLVCGDDEGARSVISSAQAPVTTYGIGPANDLRAEAVEFDGIRASFAVTLHGRRLGVARIPLVGMHNVRNALAALGAGMELGLAFDDLVSGLAGFSGIARRFEVLGNFRGVTLVDDYAHHPTEITAALGAAGDAFSGRRIIVVFQPHLFSRTRDFAQGFGRALAGADHVIVLPIFPAREAPIPGVSHEMILREVAALGVPAIDGVDPETAARILDDLVESGDIVMTVGAGDVDRVARAWKGGTDA